MNDANEGETERGLLGIDGTAGDAQDVTHPFIQSRRGDYCRVCWLALDYRRHKTGTQRRG